MQKQKMQDIAQDKEQFREMARTLRAKAAARLQGKGAESIAKNILNAGIIPKKAIIGGYVARGAEADIMPLLEALSTSGHACALPRIEEKNHIMRFHKWASGDALLHGAYGIKEPDCAMEMTPPTILLIPLLGFTKNGIRLGHGFGYYDRYIGKWRNQMLMTIIGIAYEEQMFDTLPCEEHDQYMDYIATEKQCRKINDK